MAGRRLARVPTGLPPERVQDVVHARLALAGVVEYVIARAELGGRPGGRLLAAAEDQFPALYPDRAGRQPAERRPAIEQLHPPVGDLLRRERVPLWFVGRPGI